MGFRPTTLLTQAGRPVCLLLLILCGIGCAASVPAGRYGVERIDVEGVQTLDEAALLSCLAVQPRDRFELVLGANPEPKCGAPPFDAGRSEVGLWTWPWSEWPLFDPEVFERDIDRIERWYRARGYYAARVQSSRVVPDPDDQTVEIDIRVQEGLPVRVEEIHFVGIGHLPREDRQAADAAVQLEVGERFDEAIYEQSKEAIGHALSEASYARVTVDGHVEVDPQRNAASVWFNVDPGPPCDFGEVRVEGHGDLSARAILGAAAIPEGQPYNETAIEDAQLAIYAMGPFSSVEVLPEPRSDRAVVDVVIRVVPGKLMRYGVGVGLLVGTLGYQTLGTPNVAQWDVHLSAHVEHRNFLGGMRRVRVEERPRLVFNDSFPRTAGQPELGNLLLIEGRQPAFLEARTQLIAAARWDHGPDPFELYRRDDIDTWIGPERSFFRGRLKLAMALHYNLSLVRDTTSISQTYQTTFLQYDAAIDLRDDPLFTRSGAYLGIGLQQAGFFLPSSWDYLRLAPEIRGYLPLPARMVLAARARIGIMKIFGDSIERCEDASGNPAACQGPADAPNPNYADLAELGPVAHRLRGGGANSVRGYAPNTLGDAVRRGNRIVSGGLRQWEASLELRVPITLNFGTVLFFDVGDVTRQPRFRFDRLHASVGLGLRYRTLVGPVRLDVGYRIPGLQNLGAEGETLAGVEGEPPSPGTLFGAPMALHLTLGESF